MNPPVNKTISRKVLLLIAILWAAALLIWPLFIVLNKTIESADQWTVAIFNFSVTGAFKIGALSFIDLTTLAAFVTGLSLSLVYAQNNVVKVLLLMATIAATTVIFVTAQILGIFILYGPLSQL